MIIRQSVGFGGVNNSKDIRIVQNLLNRWSRDNSLPLLKIDGICGPATLNAIETLQKRAGFRVIDKRIDPDGNTIVYLNANSHTSIPTPKNAAISIADLKIIMPRVHHAEKYFPYLCAAMREFDINTPLQQAAFLAQIAHESSEFLYFREIWGPTKEQMKYEGRADLGNTYPGDGERFKGRGPIQITGRANYKRYGDLLGLPLVDDPNRASDPDVAFRIAGAFWKTHGLNELADEGLFKTITHKVNGGYNGLEQRVAYYGRAKKVLGG